MADRVVFTKEAAVAGADVLRNSIADPLATPTPTTGVLRLFDETITIDVDTTQAALVLAETTLVGYPVGGYDITDFSTPTNAPLGGVVFTGNIVNIAYASGIAVQIGGYWIEDAAGDIREVVVYDPVRSLAAIPDGWSVAVQMGYGANP